MVDELSLTPLVTSIIYEKQNSYCRLCLHEITDSFVCFEDVISVGPDHTEMVIYDIFTNIGVEVPQEIPGLEAVCLNCVEFATQSYTYITNCQKNSIKIHNLINSLYNSLEIDDSALKNQKNILIIPHYTDIGDTKVMFVKKLERVVKRKKLVTKPFEKHVKCECDICQMQFYKITDYRKHNLDVHSLFTCSKCMETFKDNKSLEEHLSDNHKFHKFKCTQCCQYRSTKKELKKHEEAIHFGYVCNYCGKTLSKLKSLQDHEAKHENKVYCCPKCKKRYQTKEYFDRHKELCEKGLLDPHPIRSEMNRKFVCGHCSKKYSTKSSLRVHIRFEHGNAKHHECKMCDMKFTAPSYLRMHMVKHTRERNFHCNICKKVFVTKEALLYHTRRHTGEKPYSCKFCEEKFVNASSRAEHIKFKHVGPQLSCDVCSKKFVTSYFLRKHRKRHDNPGSKLFSGRNMFPANMPGEQNMRIKIEVD